MRESVRAPVGVEAPTAESVRRGTIIPYACLQRLGPREQVLIEERSLSTTEEANRLAEHWVLGRQILPAP